MKLTLGAPAPAQLLTLGPVPGAFNPKPPPAPEPMFPALISEGRAGRIQAGEVRFIYLCYFQRGARRSAKWKRFGRGAAAGARQGRREGGRHLPTIPNCSDKDLTSSASAPCKAAALEERRPLGVVVGGSVLGGTSVVVVPSGAGGISATSSDIVFCVYILDDIFSAGFGCRL